MTTALVIGFGPFPGARQNPSAELVRRLARGRSPALAGTRIFAVVLPTSYAAVDTELPALLRRYHPDAVLFFGVAARTPWLRIEQRAVNRATDLYPDVTHRKHATRALAPGLASERRVRADTRRLLFAARATGIDARLSRDAGRYICNAALFRALDPVERPGRHPARLDDFNDLKFHDFRLH